MKETQKLMLNGFLFLQEWTVKERLRAMPKYVQSVGNYAEMSIARRVSHEVSRQVNVCKNSRSLIRKKIRFLLRFQVTKNLTGPVNVATFFRRPVPKFKRVHGVPSAVDTSCAANKHVSTAFKEV
jgi:hypothetical protein